MNIANLTNAQLSQLTQSQLNFIVTLLGVTQVDLLSQSQLQQLQNSQLAGLSQAQLNAIIAFLTGTQIALLSQSQVQLLQNAQLGELSNTQLIYLLGNVLSKQFLQDNLTSGKNGQRNSIDSIYPKQTGASNSVTMYDDAYFKRGRLFDFFTLVENNRFGNKNRFTDENGLQVYANNYIIDHSNGYGWCRLLQPAATWYNACAAAGTFSLIVGSHTYNDFFLPNHMEIQEIAHINGSGDGDALNFGPFLVNLVNNGSSIWTSGTRGAGTGKLFQREWQISNDNMNNLYKYLLCRFHY